MPPPEERKVRVGGRFEIALPANPSTGYDWQLDYPADSLELTGQEHVRSSHLPGAGGITTSRFRARAPGVVTIRCSYRRPWEPRPVEERTYTVRVSG